MRISENVAVASWTLAGLAIAVWFSLAVVSRAAPEAPRVQTEQQTKTGPSDHKDTGQPKKATDATPAGVPKAVPPAHENRADPETKNRDEQGTEFWPSIFGFTIKISDTFIILFTAAIAYFTYQLKVATDKLWDAGEKQIALARDTLIVSQRAWIKRDRIAFAGPLVFRDDGLIHSHVILEFTNVGNAPALHVNMFAWLLPVIGGAIPEDGARKRFEGVRGNPVSYGFTLFPGQAYPRARSPRIQLGIHLTKDEVDAASDGAGRMVLYVAACINYAFSSDPNTNHQTSCLFEVVQPAQFLTRASGSIPDTDLILEESGFLGMDIAD
jgi:hypothetical protein